MAKVFVENFMGGKIYKVSNKEYTWESYGHTCTAASKAGLISRVNGYLRSRYTNKNK